jgi:sugar phosphate isomerase/epimerase
MKLGAFNINFYDRDLEAALASMSKYGCEAVELGCGGFITKKHFNPQELLQDEKKCKDLLKTVDKHGLFISALSCHANMAHPQKSFADAHRKDFRDTIELASKLGIERVVTFAGCPGTADGDANPSWITCPWPDYFSESLTWQWEKKLIPLWREEAAFALKHGVKMICLEMHPGDAVYTPEKLLALREAVGEVIGCNFDPSHLFWQGIDPLAALRALKGCIYHVHAKDTKVQPLIVQINGVLDNRPYSKEAERSWLFRTVGYGNGHSFWKEFISTLRMLDYDYVLSIEHEDSLMSGEEGLKKAVAFLRDVMIEKPRGAMWWD